MQTKKLSNSFDDFLPMLREYRRQRTSLHLDDKILTAWNSLMIAALCALYRITRDEKYLIAAKKAQCFIEKSLCENDTLFVSFREGRRGDHGFLDDYANYTFALLALYDATLDDAFLDRAAVMANKAVTDFYDREHGGFFLYGKESEMLIFRPKESYDGAMPSGNSMMTGNLVRLNSLKPSEKMEEVLQKQLQFMSGEAKRYPIGYAMFLLALSDYFDPPMMITVVSNGSDDLTDLPFKIPSGSIVQLLHQPNAEYKLLENKNTYYVCQNHKCLPPTHKLNFESDNIKK